MLIQFYIILLAKLGHQTGVVEQQKENEEAFSSLSIIQSLPASLFPPGWKKTLLFSAQSTGYPLAHPDTAKASRQECEERDKRPLLDVRALAVCFITPSP